MIPSILRPYRSVGSGSIRVLRSRTLGTRNNSSGSKQPAVPEEVAAKNAELRVLRARLELSDSFPLSLLSTALNTPTSRNEYMKNTDLQRAGRRLLDYRISEYITCKYPRLPTEAVKSASLAFGGEDTLTNIGTIWGIEAERSSGPIPYVEHGVENLGKLRYVPREIKVTRRVVKIQPDTSKGSSFKEAMSSAVEAVFGAVLMTEGPNYAIDLVDGHVLSRRVDFSALFQFSSPSRELHRLCVREGFVEPEYRLLAESGRHTVAPSFVVGAYSGPDKIGEGYGTSKQEARSRAAVNALKAWYLYSPKPVNYPSDGYKGEEYKGVYIDAGQIVV
ncbi:hypothetical protein CANCADRAFT_30178 [Tortispora caseinolytica NRRL Y-17796]|uniref:Large ribosomal subunit protein mL44 n=1 Tax=Tortispora caseinolytica NRRL Y-17796 TaxID=767744 RepID=A0A1E4TJI9_9ASCO|nr:hypothetical protein CANCADRAFT_30178 [Tortispora caseinolytica NRRL Y-17796]